MHKGSKVLLTKWVTEPCATIRTVESEHARCVSSRMALSRQMWGLLIIR